jgi:hypothetical protein
MKHFLVTLEIITQDYSLQELERLLSLDADTDSYSIGDIYRGKPNKYTAFKLYSRVHESADIIEHLNSIYSMVSEEKVLDIEKIPANCSIDLNIGILYDTVTCSIAIPPDYWKWMGENNISMEIICYPCSDKLSRPRTKARKKTRRADISS